MRLLPSAAACAALLATPAFAQQETAPIAWVVEASAGVVSDYRYRGYSLSDGDPAVQAGVFVKHASGIYADVLLSTIAEYGIGPDGDGAEIEATLTFGWAGSVRGFDVDAAVASYRYPEGTDVAYYELPVQVGRTSGPLTWTVGAAYAPSGQMALGDEDNRYVWGGLNLEPDKWPVSVHGSLGFEDGAYAPGGKTDWLVGLAVPIGSLTVGLDYVDSDVDEAAVVVSAYLAY